MQKYSSMQRNDPFQISITIENFASIMPNYLKSLFIVKESEMIWKSKMPHQIAGISDLFFVGDSSISYGIGTDSATHSSILCLPKINSFLKS